MLVAGIGQCCLDNLAMFQGYPEMDTKIEALEWEEQGGGPVATALVALSRLGIKPRFFGVIGDDAAGARIKQSLVGEGIDIQGLVERKKATSQTAFIAIDKKSGKRTIFWKQPSGIELNPWELGVGFLEGCGFLLLDGLMAKASLFAAKRAGELNIPVMLDAGRMREGMLEIAARCGYVVGSEEFARELGWQNNPEDFREQAKKLGPGLVTITLGERGSVTYLKDDILKVPAFEVDVVDTTGAGDVFHGGYIFGLLQGWKIEEAIKFASAMAAMKCRKLGGRPGIPGLKEVLEFLKLKENKTKFVTTQA